jgi:hypothetical protein
MTASQMYKQRVRDLVAFGAILTAMGIVAVATDRVCAGPKDGQIVRKEITLPTEGHSLSPVPPAPWRTVIYDNGWPDTGTTQLTKHKPVVF